MNDVRWDKMMRLGRLFYTSGHLTPHSALGREVRRVGIHQKLHKCMSYKNATIKDGDRGGEREEEQLAQLIGLQNEIDKGGD
ncbi:expressed protein [Echinococcus multilocularis]|uniref:Expressed protein n=1 Tax=Echinococcus multilocularis TaxID=6211 RepID=A0A068Y8X3_ECHMU|nr:expressed protein [Echinococcus multilocularis]